MANKENFAYENPSLDDLRDPFTVDPQFDNRGFHGLDASLEFAAEPIQPRSNLFFREQYPAGSSTSDSLPFMFNTREDVLPTMVGMGGGNFMVYGTSNADRNMSVPNHMSYHNATNGNLSGLNNFMSDYSSDYNLFRGGISSVGSSFTSSTNDSPSSSTPHLIENLVGHWGSDQSGTYSPFGSSCVRNVNEPILGEKLTKKTRMVAEVRPMRPSYSDVLTKSVSNQKPGKPSDGKTKAATADAKNGKGSKANTYRPSSANGSSGSRQSAGSEDPQKNRSFYLPDLKCIKNLMKFNDDEMKDFVDKGGIEAFCKAFSCKGGGDDNADISGNSVNEDYQKADATNNGEVGENVKKSSPKQMPNTKAKDEWDSSQPNKQGGTKAGKKPANQSEPKEQVPPREKEIPAGIKVEPTGRNRFPEDRKGGSNKTSDSSKLGRRNSRNVQPDRGNKKMGGGRQRRRETGGGWQALVVNQADFVVTNVLRAVQWFVSLVLDVFGLSTNLTLYMCTVFWTSSVTSIAEHYGRVCDWIRGLTILKRISSSRFWPFRRTSGSPPATDDDEDDDDSETDEKGKKKKKKRPPGGLKYNLPLPSTGEEAMKRLLACKGKDPYSILGVSQDCTDDDIKKYYKRQAFLVHPDKNNQPGAEEAFKILVHAFDIIGEPEHRKSYDLRAEKTAQAEHAWSELSDLLAQLHKKMEYVANTLRCTNCGKRHKRTLVARPVYAARMCAQCKIHHSVREGDIWAETSLFGFLWRYFACMDGAVYDITEWAACQGSNLKNLKANTHQVQYRIVLGKQAQKNSRSQQPPSSGDPDLEEFINNLYSKPENGQGGEGMPDSGVRGRKHKRKK